MTMADDSPISRRTLQVHTWGIVYSHMNMRSTAVAHRFCAAPQLHAIMPGNASGEFLAMVMKEIMQDWQALGEMSEEGELMLKDGTLITFETRFDKDDAPMLAHKYGVSSAGGAAQRCSLCSAFSSHIPCTSVCMECKPRTLEGQDTWARKLMAAGGFTRHIDIRSARKGELIRLLRAFGKPVTSAHAVRDGFDPAAVLEERSLNLAAGVVSLPAALGGLRYGTVPCIKRQEALYDYALHGGKGLADAIRQRVKSSLRKADRSSFNEIESKIMGAKTYYNGKDYTKWVAALSPMLAELGIALPPAVEHLRQAALCLARCSKYGYRLSYGTWWNEQGRIVALFTACACKCATPSISDQSAISQQSISNQAAIARPCLP